MSIFRADDRTVLVGSDPLLRKVVANHAQPKEGPMSKLLGSVTKPPDLMAIVLVEPLRPLLAMPLAMAQLPPQFADLPKVPDLVTSIGAKVNVTGGPSVTLAVRANDEAAAKELEQIIDKLLATARQQVAEQTARGLKSSDPVEQASAKYGQRMSERMLPGLRPVRKGNSFTLAVDFGKNPQLVSVTIDRRDDWAAAAGGASGSRGGPAGAVDKQHEADHVGDAQPRVSPGAIPRPGQFRQAGQTAAELAGPHASLLGHESLYHQFHLDEPWDGPHNRKLIPPMPRFTRIPASRRSPAWQVTWRSAARAWHSTARRDGRIADFTDGPPIRS